LLGVPGWFLLFFWGTVVEGAEEVAEVVVDWGWGWWCVIWLWFSSLIPKNDVDEEAAAIIIYFAIWNC